MQRPFSQLLTRAKKHAKGDCTIDEKVSIIVEGCSLPLAVGVLSHSSSGGNCKGTIKIGRL